MNETVLQSLILVLSISTLFLFYQLFRKNSKSKNDDAVIEWLKTVQASLDQTNKTLNDSLNNTSNNVVKTLQENTRQLNDRLDKAAIVIKDVGREVGQMSEIGRNMRELQEFLKSPKLRGNIGEQVLKDLISQMFPKNSFNLQYQFKTGDIVDAAIKTDAGILPIDSKFPMENFQKMMKAADDKEKQKARNDLMRDVKKHILDISKKYILPAENTMDFCLMYIPSESVYYELINITEIMEFARRQRVYIVSPSTLYAHLQTILLSFEGHKIESHSKEVFALLRAITIDYSKVEENLSTLGKHINNSSSQFINVTSSFTKIGKKLESTKNLEIEVLTQLPKETATTETQK